MSVELVQQALFGGNSNLLPASSQQAVFHDAADLAELNSQFSQRKPREIMRYTLEHAKRPVIFTNFRPLASAFLHLLTRFKPDMPVVWVDHGFNTAATYRHVERVVACLDLNLLVYAPRMSAAHYTAVHGAIPPLDTPQHELFVQIAKLEPFNRAMQDLRPDVWLNGIRREQNAYRKNLDVFTFGSHGTIRAAPMFHLTELAVEEYIAAHDLPDNHDYHDPTKGEEHRECGLLLQN